MIWKNRRRHIIFFCAAILIPAIVLVGLTVRVVHQEAELSENRLEEEHRREFEDLKRDLETRLEKTKTEAARLSNVTKLRQPNGPIIFVAAIDGSHMVPPWGESSESATLGDSIFSPDTPDQRRFANPDFQAAQQYRQTLATVHSSNTPAPENRSSAFADFFRNGKHSEFAMHDFQEASQQYRQALNAADSLNTRCAAHLALARSLIHSGNRNEARGQYLEMLQQCGETADEAGIAYRTYAAERLLHLKLDPNAATNYLASEAGAAQWNSPLNLYLMRDLAQDKPNPALDKQIQDVELIQNIAGNFHNLIARLDTPERKPDTTTWLPYGSEPWLLTTASDSASRSLLLAVSARAFATSRVTFTTETGSGREPLGSAFPGLQAQWNRTTISNSPHSVPGALYIAGLVLILGATLFGGYLFLRDVHRDLRMAELRSQFVANVSHELRTPLTAIRMYAEMVFRGQCQTPEAISKYQQTIMNESDRLTRLVDNVLAFSEEEQAARIYSLRSVDLATIVRGAAETMAYALTQHGFTLDLEIADIPPLHADPVALEQAVLNLLTNAMKYSGTSRRIQLRVKRNEDGARIEVTDWGLGIAEEEQARIFEKFYRVRSSETATITGTGLGLTIVDHIVKAHGGKVDVRSAPGEGSTFSIHLPLLRSEAAL